jgi:hypothetical protein
MVTYNPGNHKSSTIVFTAFPLSRALCSCQRACCSPVNRLTFWPPGPEARQVSNRTSFEFHCNRSLTSHISTPTNQFFRLCNFRYGLEAIHWIVPRHSLILSCTLATTLQHSTGPLPDVICMIIFSICLILYSFVQFLAKTCPGHPRAHPVHPSPFQYLYRPAGSLPRCRQ